MLIPVKKNVISQETFDIHNKMLYGDENLKLFKEWGCPFDEESYSGNGLINQQGSRGKSFDALPAKTQHNENVRSVENDDLIHFQTFQEDLLRNQKPRRNIQAVTLFPTRKTDDLYSANITAVVEKCDVVFDPKFRGILWNSWSWKNTKIADMEKDACFDPLCCKCRPLLSFYASSSFSNAQSIGMQPPKGCLVRCVMRFHV